MMNPWYVPTFEFWYKIRNRTSNVKEENEYLTAIVLVYPRLGGWRAFQRFLHQSRILVEYYYTSASLSSFLRLIINTERQNLGFGNSINYWIIRIFKTKSMLNIRNINQILGSFPIYAYSRMLV